MLYDLCFVLRDIIKPFFPDCGDLSDVTDNSPGFVNDTECNLVCSGDPIHICGGDSLLSVSLSIFMAYPCLTSCVSSTIMKAASRPGTLRKTLVTTRYVPSYVRPELCLHDVGINSSSSLV